MIRVIIRTNAYNAEKTIRRAVESVLSQNFCGYSPVYILVDNGSTDGTGKIIDEYAKKFDFIVPLHNKVNIRGQFLEQLPDILKKYSENGYFFNLDADDEYSPAFFEKMLKFMEENQLDVAACGNNFVNALNGKIYAARNLKHNLILHNQENFDVYFPLYYQFMRTVWGKVYSLQILRKFDLNDAKKILYGQDTAFVMGAFSAATRVGIYAQSLHNYYVSAKSVSNNIDSKRIISDQLLYKYAHKFLITKCGYVSQQNEKFLSDVYFCALKDTFNVIVGTQMEPVEKMRNMLDMFSSETTVGQLENGYGSGDTFKSLRSTVFKWLLAQTACRRSEGAKLAGKIFSTLYKELLQFISPRGLCYYVQKMPEIIAFIVNKDYEKALERIHIYYKRHDKDEPALAELEISLYKILNKTDSEFFSLLTDIKKNRRKCSEALDVDAGISTIIRKYPLLNGLNVDLAVLFSHSVQYIMEGDYGKALNAFLNICDVEINDEDVEKYIMFGQNLSAAAQNSNAYIYFKKVWISYLIDHSKKEVAVKELNEFLKVLPKDKDFLNFKKQIG